mgnify:CR=1 FL=1
MNDIYTLVLAMELTLFAFILVALILQDIEMMKYTLIATFIINILIAVIALILQGVLIW